MAREPRFRPHFPKTAPQLRGVVAAEDVQAPASEPRLQHDRADRQGHIAAGCQMQRPRVRQTGSREHLRRPELVVCLQERRDGIEDGDAGAFEQQQLRASPGSTPSSVRQDVEPRQHAVPRLQGGAEVTAVTRARSRSRARARRPPASRSSRWCPRPRPACAAPVFRAWPGPGSLAGSSRSSARRAARSAMLGMLTCSSARVAAVADRAQPVERCRVEAGRVRIRGSADEPRVLELQAELAPQTLRRREQLTVAGRRLHRRPASSCPSTSSVLPSRVGWSAADRVLDSASRPRR